jgi:hypothetical protein
VARKRWEFDLEDGHHVVEFQQRYFLGSRTVTVDGLTKEDPGRPFRDHSGQYPIALRGHDAAIWVSTNGFTYSFELVIDGLSLSSGKPWSHPPRPPIGGPREAELVGGIVLVCGLVLAVIAVKQGYDEYLYTVASSTATGIVQGKSITSGRYGPTYYLSYVFTDSGEVLRRGEDSVPRATYDTARPGTRFKVVYLTADPSTNRFAGKDNVATLGFLGAAAVAALVYAPYLIVSGRRRFATMRRLAEIGQPATATVMTLKSGYVRGVGKTITVEYEYEDPFGARRRGRGPAMYPAEGQLYSVGKSVRILVDPDRPKDSLLA